MRLPSASGNAEIPGVGESMRVISSDCRLQEKRVVSIDVASRFLLYSGKSMRGQRPGTYRLVTLWVSALRVNVLSLLTSAILGASGAEFWVSSIEKSMLVVKSSVMAMAASGDLTM